jgi:myosin heavy subunit
VACWQFEPHEWKPAICRNCFSSLAAHVLYVKTDHPSALLKPGSRLSRRIRVPHYETFEFKLRENQKQESQLPPPVFKSPRSPHSVSVVADVKLESGVPAAATASTPSLPVPVPETSIHTTTITDEAGEAKGESGKSEISGKEEPQQGESQVEAESNAVKQEQSEGDDRVEDESAEKKDEVGPVTTDTERSAAALADGDDVPRRLREALEVIDKLRAKIARKNARLEEAQEEAEELGSTLKSRMYDLLKEAAQTEKTQKQLMEEQAQARQLEKEALEKLIEEQAQARQLEKEAQEQLREEQAQARQLEKEALEKLIEEQAQAWQSEKQALERLMEEQAQAWQREKEALEKLVEEQTQALLCEKERQERMAEEQAQAWQREKEALEKLAEEQTQALQCEKERQERMAEEQAQAWQREIETQKRLMEEQAREFRRDLDAQKRQVEEQAQAWQHEKAFWMQETSTVKRAFTLFRRQSIAPVRTRQTQPRLLSSFLSSSSPRAGQATLPGAPRAAPSGSQAAGTLPRSQSRSLPSLVLLTQDTVWCASGLR